MFSDLEPWFLVSLLLMYELGNLCEFCDDHYYHTNSFKKGTAKHYNRWLIVLIIFPLKINPYMSTFIHIDIAEVYHTKISVSSISCLCCIKDKRYCFNLISDLLFVLLSISYSVYLGFWYVYLMSKIYLVSLWQLVQQ